MAYSVSALEPFNPQMNRTGLPKPATALTHRLIPCLGLALALCLGACGQRGPLFLPEAEQPGTGPVAGTENSEETGESDEETP